MGFLGLLFLAYLENRQIDKNIKASVEICSWSNVISPVLTRFSERNKTIVVDDIKTKSWSLRNDKKFKIWKPKHQLFCD